MPQPEAVDVRVGMAEEFSLNIPGGPGAEGLRSGYLQGQPGLDGQDVKGILGIKVVSLGIQGPVLGVKEEMPLPDARGLAGIVKNIGLDETAEAQSNLIIISALGPQV